MANLGETLGKMHPVTSGGTFAIIAATNPRFPTENSQGHQGLAEDLALSGLKHEESQSEGDGHHGPVFLVYNPTRAQAMELGRKHGQESIIFSENGQHHLVYTNGPKAGKFHAAKGPLHFFKNPPVDNGGPLTRVPGLGSVRFVFDLHALHDVPKVSKEGSQMSEPTQKNEVNFADVKRELAKSIQRQIDSFSKNIEEMRARELKKSDTCPICGNEDVPGACTCVLQKGEKFEIRKEEGMFGFQPGMFEIVGDCAGCGGPVTADDLGSAQAGGFCDDCHLNGHPVMKGEAIKAYRNTIARIQEAREKKLGKVPPRQAGSAHYQERRKIDDEHDSKLRQVFARKGNLIPADIKASEMQKDELCKCGKMCKAGAGCLKGEGLDKSVASIARGALAAGALAAGVAHAAPVSHPVLPGKGARVINHHAPAGPYAAGTDVPVADVRTEKKPLVSPEELQPKRPAPTHPVAMKGEDFINLKDKGERIKGVNHENPNPVPEKTKEVPGNVDEGSGGTVTKGKGKGKNPVKKMEKKAQLETPQPPEVNESDPGECKHCGAETSGASYCSDCESGLQEDHWEKEAEDRRYNKGELAKWATAGGSKPKEKPQASNSGAIKAALTKPEKPEVKKGEVPVAKPPTAPSISSKPPTSASNPGKVKKAYEVVGEESGKNHVKPVESLEKQGINDRLNRASGVKPNPATAAAAKIQVPQGLKTQLAAPKPAPKAPGVIGQMKNAVTSMLGTRKQILGKSENFSELGNCPLCNQPEHAGNCG